MENIIQRFLSGGSVTEQGKRFKHYQMVFNIILLLVIFWLPMQWYLQNKHLLTMEYITIANWVVWFIFLIEVVVMTSLASHKVNYFFREWLNILIIILVFPPLWSTHTNYFVLLRYLRFLILFRLVIPQFYNLHRLLLRNKFGITLTVCLLVTILGGIIEAYLDPSIGSLGNGIWWAWQTVTTVGYGGVVPHTFAGRVFGGLLMLLGVGLFSLVSANLAAYFIERGQAQKKRKSERVVIKELSELNVRFARLEELVSQFVQNQKIEDGSVKSESAAPNDKP
jgi:voltage-gated potassium channel